MRWSAELTPIEWDERADLQAPAVASAPDEDEVGGVSEALMAAGGGFCRRPGKLKKSAGSLPVDGIIRDP